MADELQTGSASGLTIYGQVLRVGQRYNSSSEEMEAYSSSNYASYVLAMDEDGNSGAYWGDFPSALATAGLYAIFYYRQMGASPAEGDPVVGTGEVRWNGTQAIAEGTPNALTGPAWLAYLKRAFKRTDKDTEIYEATTDIVKDLRIKLPMLDDEVTKQTADAIVTLGQYKLDLEEDNNVLLDVSVRDGTNSRQLNKISKSKYDRLYPNPDATNVSKARPRDFAVFQGQIWVGPVPDKTTYEYWVNYRSDAGETIDASTTAVPYSNRYRLYLKWGVLAVLYSDLKNNEEAGKNGKLYDDACRDVIAPREEANRDSDGYVENCDLT